MTFDATVHRVLIASPADVGDERDIIPEIIAEWNAANAARIRNLMLPIKWETHSFPSIGDRPQEVINKQIVKDCDLLVGVFWTRIGTDTGKSISGTVEEIEQFVDSNKPVMLYFSQSPVDPDKIDIDQFGAMRKFRDEMRLKGLTENYSGIADFRQKFTRQLTYNMNSILQKKVSNSPKQEREDTKTLIKSPIILPKLKKDDVISLIIQAINLTADSEGWSNVAALGKYLNTYTPVNYRALGYDTLTKYLKSRPELEVRQEQRSPRATALDTASVRVVLT